MSAGPSSVVLAACYYPRKELIYTQRKGKAHRKSRNTEDTIIWKKGCIGIPQDGGKYKAVHYEAKVYDEGSQYGIDGGRISKLALKMDGEWIATYDRGWDIKPTCPEAEMALAILMEEYK